MVLALLVWYEKVEGDMKGGRKINLLANRLIVACIDTIDHPSIELVATHPLWWPSAREGHKSAAEAPLLAHLTNGANNGGIHPLFRSNLSFRCYARSDASLLLFGLLTLLLWLLVYDRIPNIRPNIRPKSAEYSVPNIRPSLPIRR